VAQEEALAIRESLALASIFHPQVTTIESAAAAAAVSVVKDSTPVH
jgi:hypothetical protein